MKQFFILLLSFLLIMAFVTGCDSNDTKASEGTGDSATSDTGLTNTPGNTDSVDSLTQSPTSSTQIPNTPTDTADAPTDTTLTPQESLPIETTPSTEESKEKELKFKLNDEENAYVVVGIGDFDGTELTIPSVYQELPVVAIGSGAFESCEDLTSVVIPNSVILIDSSAFHNCKNLTSIVIPDGVERIGNYAFRGCEAITEITIPASVSFIGWGTFWNCDRLTALYIAKPDGWIASGTYLIMEEELADPAKAVTLLQDTYGQYPLHQMNFSVGS